MLVGGWLLVVFFVMVPLFIYLTVVVAALLLSVLMSLVLLPLVLLPFVLLPVLLQTLLPPSRRVSSAFAACIPRVINLYPPRPPVHVVCPQVKKYHESALIEAQILRDVNTKERAIRQKDQESLCVEMLGQFEHAGHCCLVFECLGFSLYDYLKKNNYRGFPMNVLRPIAQELLQVNSSGFILVVAIAVLE